MIYINSSTVQKRHKINPLFLKLNDFYNIENTMQKRFQDLCQAKKLEVKKKRKCFLINNFQQPNMFTHVFKLKIIYIN